MAGGLVLAWLVLMLAVAGEHDARPPPVPATGEATEPAGPPLDVRVPAGVDLAAALAGLPRGSRLGLGPGVHRGPVVLDRPVELYGEPGAVISGGGQGSVIVVAAPDVWLHDLRVTAGGHLQHQDDSGVVVAADRFRVERVAVDESYIGIDLRQADDGIIRGCHVRGDPARAFGLRGDGIRMWEAHRNVIERNTLEHVRDLVIWYSDDNRIRANVVTGSRYGVHTMHTRGNVIAGNRFEDDVVGVFVMYSDAIVIEGNTVQGSLGPAGVGLGFKESDGITATGNDIVGNTTGIYLDTTPHRVDGSARFERNLIAANEIGVRFHGGQAGAVFEGNGFVADVSAVAVEGRGDATQTRFEGNFWSGYSGYDLDRDGAGDVAYEPRSASGHLRDRNPDLAYFTGTPASALLDLFAAAFPMFAPKPLLRDDEPAMVWTRRGDLEHR